MGIENIDITNCSIDDRRKIVAAYEAKLAEEKARRDNILADIRETTARADKGDQQARFELASLNKQDAAAGRLILSIQAQVAEARKRLDMAENQAATVEANGHAMAIPCDGAGKWRWFEITTLDGRVIRHRAASLDALQAALLKGYTVTAEVFGASAIGFGGVAAQIGSDVPSIMAGLLAAHGKELETWLASRGVKPTAA